VTLSISRLLDLRQRPLRLANADGERTALGLASLDQQLSEEVRLAGPAPAVDAHTHATKSVDEKQNYRKPDTTDHQSDPAGGGWLYFQVAAVIASVTEPARSFTARFERPNLHFAK